MHFQENVVFIESTFFLELLSCSRGRVVKALDLKSNGVSPRRFESCRLRNKLLVKTAQPQKKIYSLSGVGFEPTQSFDYESLNLTP